MLRTSSNTQKKYIWTKTIERGASRPGTTTMVKVLASTIPEDGKAIPRIAHNCNAMDSRASSGATFTTYIQSAQHTLYEAVYWLHSLISIHFLGAFGIEADRWMLGYESISIGMG